MLRERFDGKIEVCCRDCSKPLGVLVFEVEEFEILCFDCTEDE